MTKTNVNGITGALLKCDKDWVSGIESLYTKGFIGFANRWNIGDKTKPVALGDGDELFLYIEEATKNQVKVIAKGIFRERIFNVDKGLFSVDVKREMTVKEAFALYNWSNGSLGYGSYKKLLQKCADEHMDGKKIIINDHTRIGATIITDLIFYPFPQHYKFQGNAPNQCGFRYI